MASVFHATACKEVVGCFTKRRVEQAMEMKRREAGFAGGGIQKNLRLVTGSQKIAGTTQAAKSFVIHQPQRWMRLRHGFYCTERTVAEINRKSAKKLWYFPHRCRHDVARFI